MPLSSIYGYALKIRNKGYDKGSKAVTAVSVPVISVGNISAGGTGKTPFTAFLVNEIIKLGLKPAIVSRGYKRKSKGTVVVSNGKSLLVSVAEAGDEMYMLADELKVPAVVGEAKSKAALTAAELFNPDCIVIDDGFQHRALKRDLDIVLVDRKTCEDQRLIPYGRLREPLSSLSRADIICLVDLDAHHGLEILRQFPNKHFIAVELKARNFVSVFSHKEPLTPSEVVAVSGIANPSRFTNSLASKGIRILKSFTFPDHHNYSESEVKNIISFCRQSNCQSIVTTAKDAVKIKFFSSLFAAPHPELLVLKLEVEMEDKSILTDALLKILESKL